MVNKSRNLKRPLHKNVHVVQLSFVPIIILQNAVGIPLSYPLYHSWWDLERNLCSFFLEGVTSCHCSNTSKIGNYNIILTSPHRFNRTYQVLNAILVVPVIVYKWYYLTSILQSTTPNLLISVLNIIIS